MKCSAKRGRPPFSEVYGDAPQQINLMIKRSDFDDLTDRAATMGRSKSSVIREAINAYLSDRRRTLSHGKAVSA